MSRALCAKALDRKGVLRMWKTGGGSRARPPVFALTYATAAKSRSVPWPESGVHCADADAMRSAAAVAHSVHPWPATGPVFRGLTTCAAISRVSPSTSRSRARLDRHLHSTHHAQARLKNATTRPTAALEYMAEKKRRPSLSASTGVYAWVSCDILDWGGTERAPLMTSLAERRQR